METLTNKILIADGDTGYFGRLSKFLNRVLHRKNKLEILTAKNERESRLHLKENPDIKLVLLDDSIECHDFSHLLNFITKILKFQILIISDRTGNISEHKVVNKQDLDSIKTCIEELLNNSDKFAKGSGIIKNSFRQDIEYLMGKGKIISAVLDRVEKYAGIDEPVLIEGATGTGKELIANYMHQLSGRENMITVNCGTFAKELAASELFGSVKGAFTDAQNKKRFCGRS